MITTAKESALTDAELAWLGGVLEGAGNFWSKYRKDRGRRYPRVTVGATDRDTVETVAHLLGRLVGTEPRAIYEAKAPSRGSRKVRYQVSVTGAPAVTVMRLVRPLMHSRQAADIDEVLKEFDA